MGSGYSLQVLSLAVVYVGLFALAPFCALVSRRREHARDDWAWWVISPIFTGSITRFATLGGFALLAPSFSHALTWPIAAQIAAALVIADVAGYLSHRVRHCRGLWELHAIHHASTKLDWPAGARMHPLDDVVDNVFVGVVLLACGFDRAVFAAIGPILILHTMLTHLDVSWRFGPLRYVFVSPAMHRWHHARGNTRANFAGMFAFIDVAFGTFSLPDGEPDEFGSHVGHGVERQLAHPFRALFRWRRRT